MLWEEEPEDEFLAAPHYGDGDTEEDFVEVPAPAGFTGRDSDLHEEIDPDNRPWTPDQGFPDGLRAVRIWTDEDGRLKRVRVSLNWRTKLKESSLDSAFFAAFMASNAIRVTGRHMLPSPEPLPLPEVSGKLSWTMLAEARRAQEEVDARIAALGDVPPTRWVGQPATGTDYDGAISITLGIFGQPVSAHFDQDWLAGPVRSSDIARGLQVANKEALKRFRPPHVEFGERELLAREYDRISRMVFAAMANGLDG